ncbi:MAG: hypothetical protein VX252_04065 [Myxococcota bacterium]|nr:hypothetical protein [Myxococcota bacterium]
MHRMTVWLTVALLGLTGCITQSVTEKVVDHYDLDIKLRGEKKLFGSYEPLGYNQPVTISSERLATILGGIEIDIRKSKNSAVRERRPALSAKMLLSVSKSLPQAFAKASPNQQIIVMALRKQMQKGIFNRKYLTSFTTYVKGDDLYVFFSRIEWQIDESSKNARIPQPFPGEVVMPFETVATPGYELVGSQGVRVKWKRTQFGPALSSSETPPAPRSTPAPAVVPAAATAVPVAPAATAPPQTTVVPAAPTPAASTSTPAPTPEAATAAAGAAAAATPAAAPARDPLQGLTAADLRDLASLEDAYQAGRMDKEQYLRERARILNRGN